MAAIMPTLYALVLVASDDFDADLPYVVRDHTKAPNRLLIYPDLAQAQAEYDHFAASFPRSRYKVVAYVPSGSPQEPQR